MTCKRCGKEVETGALFCPSCGEKVTIQESPVNGKTVKKKKGMSITAILILSCVLVVLILIGALAAINAPTDINVEKYVSVNFEKYAGYGTAIWEFDKDRFIEDYKEKLLSMSDLKDKLKEADDDIVKLVVQYCSVCDISPTNSKEEDVAKLLSYILFHSAFCAENQNLNNGDEIAFILDLQQIYGEETINRICDLFGVTLENMDMTYTVSGLTEVEKFDPFEEVVLSYSGAAPRGQVLLANYPDNGLSYSLNAPSIVTNGDEFTVSVSYGEYELEEYVNMYGKAPLSIEKTYVVSGLPQYMTSASQIPGEILLEMQSQSEDIIKATTAEWMSGYDLDISYIGNYMLFAKKPESEPQNMFILLYKMHYVNSFADYNGVEQEYSTDYYFYVNWDDLILNEDGTCSYDKNTYWKTKNTFRVATNIFKEYSNVLREPYNQQYISFTGYQTLDEIYSYYITRNIEYYKFEENMQE